MSFRSPDGTFLIARIAGVELRAMPSWLVQVAALTVLARSLVDDVVVRGIAGAPALALSLGIALGIVACIVVHELAHTIVARAYRLPVQRILLFLYGGVSQIGREAPSPRAEYSIAVAGPLASVVLATLFAGVGRLLNPALEGVPGPWWLFARINIALALFNLLPAFPMDGGRVLRSALWAGVRDRARATAWAAIAGKGWAGLMIAGGIVLVVSGGEDAFQGVWLFLLGSFLFGAASSAGRTEGGTRPNEPREPG